MASGKKVVSRQKKFLKLVGLSSLAKEFYFTGGTALSFYYLHHRFSEDLDFFCEKEFELEAVNAFLKTNKAEIGYDEVDIQISFNRYIFQLRFSDKDYLKTEFTYFPFERIEKLKPKNGLVVDSLLDIAVNKLFTINQKPRGRDYYDLFYILKEIDQDLPELRRLAKQKFDWHVDQLQLGSQLNKVAECLDDPILLKTIDKNEVEEFFKKQAELMKGEIIS